MTDERFVSIAKALADPTRRRMIEELRRAGGGRLTCSCLCGCFALSQPTVSHHIGVLKEAGLISVRPRGQFHELTLRSAELREFAAAIAGPGSPRLRKKATRRAAKRSAAR